MRPRPEDRGKRDSASLIVFSLVRFNAATARRSWKNSRRLSGIIDAEHGFNAATARRPWKKARVVNG